MGEFFAEEPGRFLLRKSLVTMARKSAGSRADQNLFFEIDGREVDVLRNGDLSCAVVLSKLLHFFGIVQEPHTFVTGLLKDMVEKSDWRQDFTPDPKEGSVVVWDLKRGKSGELHRHIGLHLGNGEAFSNDDETLVPQIHHETFGVTEDGEPVRHIVETYRHPRLNEG